MKQNLFSLMLLATLCLLPLGLSAQRLHYGTDPNGFVVLFQGDGYGRLVSAEKKYQNQDLKLVQAMYESFKSESSEAHQFYHKQVKAYQEGDRRVLLDGGQPLDQFKGQGFSVYQLCAVVLDDLAFRYVLTDSLPEIRSILLYELGVLFSYEKSLEYAQDFWKRCVKEGGVLAMKAGQRLSEAQVLITKNSVSMSKVGSWQSFIFRGGAWVIAVFIAVLMTFIFFMKAGKPGFDDLLEDNRREEQKALLEKVSAKTGSVLR